MKVNLFIEWFRDYRKSMGEVPSYYDFRYKFVEKVVRGEKFYKNNI